VIDIVTRTVPRGDLTPERVYGTLRAQTPGRSSFLLESGVPGDPNGRYSIVGYRTLRESMYPGGGDALRLLADELGSLEAPSADELAARFTQALVGYVAYDLAHVLHDVEPWPTQSILSRMMGGANVGVFDHEKDTITIAARNVNAVNRYEWEMKNGPKLDELPAPDASARPQWADPAIADDAFLAQLARAEERLAAGDLERLVLSRRFVSPQRNADPFDVYRALRALAPAPYQFFLEFAEMPMAPGFVVLGASHHGLARHDGGAEAAGDRLAGMRSAFPGAPAVGAPIAAATRAVREIEEETRDVHGGAVGYLLPGGAFDFALVAPGIVLRNAQFEVTARTPMDKGTAAARAADGAHEDIAAALAAVRAAHDAAEARG
jgi:anthranilate synthase component 1